MADTTGPAHRVQSAIVEYGFPQGHLGHLSASEEKTLKEFKALVIEKGMFKPASDTHEFGTHDDAMLLCVVHPRAFPFCDARRADIIFLGDSSVRDASMSRTPCSNSRPPRTGVLRIRSIHCTRRLILTTTMQPGDLLALPSAETFDFDVLMLSIVPAMDRPTRPPWDSGLSV